LEGLRNLVDEDSEPEHDAKRLGTGHSHVVQRRRQGHGGGRQQPLTKTDHAAVGAAKVESTLGPIFVVSRLCVIQGMETKRRTGAP
jgi:hypothetical protein